MLNGILFERRRLRELHERLEQALLDLQPEQFHSVQYLLGRLDGHFLYWILYWDQLFLLHVGLLIQSEVVPDLRFQH